MSNVTKIHQSKSPIRVHFIVEWAEKRNLSQADIVRQIGADKALVSRWFNKGVNPGDEYLEKLSALFGTDIHGLYRHPDDDWLSKFFKDKTDEQRDRAIEMLRLMFGDEKREAKS